MIVLGPEAIDEELTPSRREAMGELHLRRIDLADEVRVVSGGPAAVPDLAEARPGIGDETDAPPACAATRQAGAPVSVVSQQPDDNERAEILEGRGTKRTTDFFVWRNRGSEQTS